MQGPQKGGLSRIPTSHQGQEVLPGRRHQPPLPARDLRAQRAVAPVHVARQQPEVLGERAPRLHQLVCMRQPSCVDALQNSIASWSDPLPCATPTCMHTRQLPALESVLSAQILLQSCCTAMRHFVAPELLNTAHVAGTCR